MSFEVVDVGTFVRQWAVQSLKIGWLLGAGAEKLHSSSAVSSDGI